MQLLSLCQRRAIFPGRRQPSIVASDELNFRVRNGNGWTLTVIGTDFVLADLVLPYLKTKRMLCFEKEERSSMRSFCGSYRNRKSGANEIGSDASTH